MVTSLTKNTSILTYVKSAPLVQALRLCTGRMAHRGSRGIAILFHDHSTRRGWGVSVTPRPPFTPRKDPVPIVQEDGWAPGPVWTGAKKSRPPPGFDPRTVQPVASRYTDYATRPTYWLTQCTLNGCLSAKWRWPEIASRSTAVPQWVPTQRFKERGRKTDLLSQTTLSDTKKLGSPTT